MQASSFSLLDGGVDYFLRRAFTNLGILPFSTSCLPNPAAHLFDAGKGILRRNPEGIGLGVLGSHQLVRCENPSLCLLINDTN